MDREDPNPRAHSPTSSDKLRFFVLWTGRTKACIGGRMLGEFYKQEFPIDTPLGDAFNTIRTVLIRRAGRLEETETGETDAG